MQWNSIRSDMNLLPCQCTWVTKKAIQNYIQYLWNKFLSAKCVWVPTDCSLEKFKHFYMISITFYFVDIKQMTSNCNAEPRQIAKTKGSKVTDWNHKNITLYHFLNKIIIHLIELPSLITTFLTDSRWCIIFLIIS